jgi:diguanylate cyclase (GGDEF)-like protein/PAS domain S-box-containing protein
MSDPASVIILNEAPDGAPASQLSLMLPHADDRIGGRARPRGGANHPRAMRIRQFLKCATRKTMKKFSKLIFGEQNRIGRRLIVLVIAFSSMITLVNSGIELFSEYRELRNGLDRDLEELSIYVPSLSGSVWDFDEKQIQLSLDALALLSNIDHVTVTTAGDQKRWTAGKQVSGPTVSKSYSLRHKAMGKDTVIGTFDVVASLTAIHKQVASRAVAIILSNGVKTFLVALFMAFLFRRLVTLRLEGLARKVTTLVPQTPHADPAGMPDTRPIPYYLDELAAVEWTLDKTAENLKTVVDSQRMLNDELKSRVAEQDALLQNALVGIVLVRNRRIVSCNRRFEEILGFGAETLVGQSARILYPTDEDYSKFEAQADDILSQGLSYSGSLRMVKRDGASFWGEITGRALDRTQLENGSIWIITDVTERKNAEAKVDFMAYHDALTELPNRLLFKDRFEQAMAYADRSRSRVGLLFLDLDNFKTINDSLGHAVGDSLIKEIALRLKACVRDSDTVGRQGGDEFLVVLPNIPEANSAAPTLVKMMERLVEPCNIDGHELVTSVSIGAAIYPDDGKDFETLMKKADMAMYRAKDAGRNTYRFFDEQMNVEALEQLSMRIGLRHALARGEFVLHYQPQIDLSNGTLVGVEALIRWNHPELGMVPPGRFISVAEDSGMIVPIGEWVLHEACRQAVAWQKTVMPDLGIAVNLSAVQFKRGDIERSVFSALKASGIDPRLVELELTESILIVDTESVLATVKRLKLMGVKLSIDDFGTGYSSLSYLKRFQVDKLKIDQSFVRGLASDPEDAAIVRAIIQMAKSFGLRTIAEGVEDERSLDLLRLFQCDEAQGYFFARPMPAEELPDYLATIRTSLKKA